jgi:hypothetical protein
MSVLQTILQCSEGQTILNIISRKTQEWGNFYIICSSLWLWKITIVIWLRRFLSVECSLISRYQHFTGTSYLHLQDEVGGSRFFKKAFVPIYQTTWHHISEDSNLHSHHGNIKPHIIQFKLFRLLQLQM